MPILAERRPWVGEGHGGRCLLCGQPITATHWEYEVHVAPVGEVRAHALCFRIWGEESAQLRKTA